MTNIAKAFKSAEKWKSSKHIAVIHSMNLADSITNQERYSNGLMNDF